MRERTTLTTSASRLFFAAAVVLTSVSAQAAKWHSCPQPPLPLYPSTTGALTTPFVHSDHLLTVVLNEDEVEKSGGFAPKGNEVRVTLRPPFGESIPFPLLVVDSASSSSLSFPFPDASEVLGRPAVGPAEVVVSTAGREIARIDAADLVALPLATDVADAMLAGVSFRVQAALEADGELWIPVTIHGDHMPMPGCEGDFVFPILTQLGAAVVDSSGDTKRSLSIRSLVAYLGDMNINDYNFYGMVLNDRVKLVQVAGTLGVSVCQLNDAINLVLRVKTDISMLRGRNSEKSPPGTPVELEIFQAPEVPSTKAGTSGSMQSVVTDSFGNSCVVRGLPMMPMK